MESEPGPHLPVLLNVPNVTGNNESVAEIVAFKKMELARAAIHHANITLKQAQQRMDSSDKAHETELTRAKLDDVKVNQVRRELKVREDKVEKLRDMQRETVIRIDAAQADVADASKKEKPAKQSALELEEARRDMDAKELKDTQAGVKEMSMAAVDASDVAHTAHQAESHELMKNIALRMKLEAAKEELKETQYQHMTAENAKAVAMANATREVKQKHVVFTKADVARTQKKLKETDPGTAYLYKPVKEIADNALTAYETAKKDFSKAEKKADKVSTDVVGKAKAWVKKNKYKKTVSNGTTTKEQEEMLTRINKAFDTTLKAVDKNTAKNLTEQAKVKLEAIDDRASDGTKDLEKAEEAAVEGKFMDKVAPNIDEKILKEKAREEEEKEENKKLDSELKAEQLSDPEENEKEEAGMETFGAELDAAGKQQEADDASAAASGKPAMTEEEKEEKEEEDDSPLSYHWMKVKGKPDSGTDAKLASSRLSMHWHTVETDTPDDIMNDIFGSDEPSSLESA